MHSQREARALFTSLSPLDEASILAMDLALADVRRVARVERFGIGRQVPQSVPFVNLLRRGDGKSVGGDHEVASIIAGQGARRNKFAQARAHCGLAGVAQHHDFRGLPFREQPPRESEESAENEWGVRHQKKRRVLAVIDPVIRNHLHQEGLKLRHQERQAPTVGSHAVEVVDLDDADHPPLGARQDVQVPEGPLHQRVDEAEVLAHRTAAVPDELLRIHESLTHVPDDVAVPVSARVRTEGEVGICAPRPP
mmetsp:Transcript_4525/g.11371  ORF Transcript_4525/g.11371 Transcript_4525/m.11371 type:complete len:252 (+) Transcript_4525:561-1316(+)